MRHHASRFRRKASCYSSTLVRPPRLVVGSVLTAALALVALPGLAGSRAPSPIEPLPAGAFQQFTVPANASRSTASISSLDAAFVSNGAVGPGSTIGEPAVIRSDPAVGRSSAAEPATGALSESKKPAGARSASVQGKAKY